MSTIRMKMNLSALKSKVVNMKTSEGEKEFLCIPIEKNDLYKGQKGVYLNLVAFQASGKDFTHIIKQSFDKSKIDKMSEAEKKELPIFGTLNIISNLQTLNENEEINC